MNKLLLAGAICVVAGNGAWYKGTSSSTPNYLNSPASLAPAQVTTLRVAVVGDTVATLSWVEVSNGGSGGIVKYVIRYGRVESYSWGSSGDVVTGGCATPVYGSTVGGGRIRSCVVSGLLPNTGYTFQVASYTGVLNSTAIFGPLSNTVSDTTNDFTTKLGPLVVMRAPVFNDSVTIASASISDMGATRFSLNGRFSLGSRILTGYDSLGNVVAKGYLLVVKP